MTSDGSSYSSLEHVLPPIAASLHSSALACQTPRLWPYSWRAVLPILPLSAVEPSAPLSTPRAGHFRVEAHKGVTQKKDCRAGSAASPDEVAGHASVVCRSREPAGTLVEPRRMSSRLSCVHEEAL